MDTVTYPNAKVQEVLKSYVCVRVEYDHAPELVKQYGVSPLPDVRLLSPEGKELAKLVGFSSASRLATTCNAMLDRLAGKGTGVRDTGEGKVRKVEGTPQAIDDAVAKGVAYLKGAWRAAHQEGPLSPEPLVLYAFVACGVDPKDKDVQDALTATLSVPVSGTYQAAFRALALTRLDAKAHLAELKDCARFLCDTQLPNGQWTYHASAGATPAIGDNSNTAFALLGLAACKKAGIEVPDAVLKKAESWWTSSENEDGGWGYRSDREKASYLSMTENAMSSLVLLDRLLNGPRDIDNTCAVKPGEWWRAHFSAERNTGSAYQEGRLLYHLYALERLGDLIGKDTLGGGGGHLWYKEGSEFLLGTQREDGSWDDGADTPVPNTCLALLFLKRSTQGLR